jgi:hypothetical protein
MYIDETVWSESFVSIPYEKQTTAGVQNRAGPCVGALLKCRRPIMHHRGTGSLSYVGDTTQPLVAGRLPLVLFCGCDLTHQDSW